VELVVVLAVVLVVVLKSAVGFLPVLTPVVRVELEPVLTNK
jgi:predicted anti-sigma-YlaC factor YlaD